MALSLVKGKLRQIVNKAYKSSEYLFEFRNLTELNVSVTNVRMYVDNTMPIDWPDRCRFEIDLEITVPTYEGSPGYFRFGADRNISSMLKRSVYWDSLLNSFKSKAYMFTAQKSNYVKVKKISIIRNSTPPSLNN